MAVSTTKIIPSGDKEKALNMRYAIGMQLNALRTQLSLSGLNQLGSVRHYSDGSVVKMTSVFGRETVEIYVPVTTPVVSEAAVPTEELKDMVLAIIINIRQYDDITKLSLKLKRKDNLTTIATPQTSVLKDITDFNEQVVFANEIDMSNYKEWKTAKWTFTLSTRVTEDYIQDIFSLDSSAYTLFTEAGGLTEEEQYKQGLLSESEMHEKTDPQSILYVNDVALNGAEENTLAEWAGEYDFTCKRASKPFSGIMGLYGITREGTSLGSEEWASINNFIANYEPPEIKDFNYNLNTSTELWNYTDGSTAEEIEKRLQTVWTVTGHYTILYGYITEYDEQGYGIISSAVSSGSYSYTRTHQYSYNPSMFVMSSDSGWFINSSGVVMRCLYTATVNSTQYDPMDRAMITVSVYMNWSVIMNYHEIDITKVD